MKDQFQLFWRRDRRTIWIKALVVGLSAALLATGALLLAHKLVQTPSWLCLLGIVALPIVTGAFLLLQRSNFKKVAKRLDNDFRLNEKVQTMIEFRNSDDEMVSVQRKDTLEKLSEIPLKKMKFKHLWLYIVMIVLASALMVTAVACPMAGEEPGVTPPEPDREITDWEWQALDELIDYVSDSEADDAVMKPKTLESLYNLKNLLKNGVSESSLESFVNIVIVQIRNHEVDAAAQEDITEEQIRINGEVCEYVVETLCRIFDITKPDDGQDVTDPNKPDDGKEDSGNNGGGGTGEVVMGSNDRMFDDILGYVSYSQVITEYYNEIINAMDEEILSREEWEDYLETYFGYLYGSKE